MLSFGQTTKLINVYAGVLMNLSQWGAIPCEEPADEEEFLEFGFYRYKEEDVREFMLCDVSEVYDKLKRAKDAFDELLPIR